VVELSKDPVILTLAKMLDDVGLRHAQQVDRSNDLGGACNATAHKVPRPQFPPEETDDPTLPRLTARSGIRHLNDTPSCAEPSHIEAIDTNTRDQFCKFRL
jgi:hypothetical protein